MSAIILPNEATVRCQCVVDLIGRSLGSINKPNYRFRVTVWGEPPHAVCHKYEIIAYGEDTAAHLGLRRFQEEVSLTRRLLASLVEPV